MNKQKKLRQALGFLESKGLDEIDFAIDFGYTGNVELEIDSGKLEPEQTRLIKRIFGPLKASDAYDGKNLVGEVRINEENILRVKLLKVYSCKTVDPEGLTEEKWDHIKEQIKEGLIKVQECIPVND